jgi:hypothetical protein
MRLIIEEPRPTSLVKPLISAGMCAYLAASSVLIWNGRDQLYSPLADYRPLPLWTVTGTNDARIAALVDAGRSMLAASYQRLELFSAIFILYALLVGIAGAMPKGRRSEADPVALMTMTVASVLGYAAFSCGAVFCALLYNAQAIPVDIAGMPAYWFLTMVAASIMIAWTGGLLVHDLAVLALTRRPDHSVLRR